MRSLVLDGDGLRFEPDRTDPEPAAGEALVRVTLAGICGTDLELTRGYKGFEGVPGHEFVGVVERADDRPDLVGERVVGEINAVCGRCATCESGRRTHCPARTVLGILGRDGAFAERLALPVENLHLVPYDVPDEVAVFAEPVAAACHILEQVTIARGDRALVLGGGRLGLLCAQVLRYVEAEVTVLGRHARGLERLAGQPIATSTSSDTVEGLFDVVVEATGTSTGFDEACRFARPGGTVVLKSTCAGAATVDLAHVVVDELRVVGSRCGPLDTAVQFLRVEQVDVAPLVDARYPLEEGVAAFEHAARPGALKILLAP
jgi:threonine dehydrogenase-like Zn-dependent dehydrogenase